MKKNVANSVCVGETFYFRLKDVFYLKKYPNVGKSYFQ